MRPIKFRGRDLSGYPVYGGISCNGKAIILDEGDGSRALVDPDSVAQLVGYDANGKEVYEGDTLVSTTGETLIGALWTTDFSNFTLKEGES